MANTTAHKKTKKKSMLVESFEQTTVALEEFTHAESHPEGTIARISGVAAKANVVNRNKRYYSASVFERAIGSAQTKLSKGRLLGQLDHPGFFDDASLKSATIKYTRLAVENDPGDPDRPLITFEGYVLDTPDGHQLKMLMKAGVDVAMSTRGYAKKTSKGKAPGSTTDEEVTIIDEYEFDGIDPVLEPSNEFARIAKHEEEGDDEMELTLEALREKHPDLVTAIEAAARKGYVSEADRDAAITAAVDAAKKDFKPTIDEAFLKANNLVTVAAADAAQAKAITDAVKPVTERAEKAEKDAKEAKEALVAKDADARKGQRAERIKAVCEAPEVVTFAPILRKMLEAVNESVELTDEFVKSKVEEAKNIYTAIGTPDLSGKGKPRSNERGGQKDGKEKEQKESEEHGVHASLAGFEPSPVEVQE